MAGPARQTDLLGRDGFTARPQELRELGAMIHPIQSSTTRLVEPGGLSTRSERYRGHVADLDTMLQDLERLVSVESPSHAVDALAKSADAVAQVVLERTGTPARIVDSADGPHVHWSGGGEPRVLLL